MCAYEMKHARGAICLPFCTGIRKPRRAGRLRPLRVIVDLHNDLCILRDKITAAIKGQLRNDDFRSSMMERVIVYGRAVQIIKT